MSAVSSSPLHQFAELQLARGGDPPAPAPVAVPDHELLHVIGRGSYGEVWLAVNVMRAGRAVKIVRRANFESDRPFEREFAALERYEPVSRAADGLVNVLHAGRVADGSLFYYVMELADADGDPAAAPLRFSADSLEVSRAAAYTPRTLRSELRRLGGRFPLAECVAHARSLTQALASLHAAGLTHRDIKPSNIIFVNNRPKLADIGLVGLVGETRSFVGTEGYIPPEGPGQPGADLYALGMVLYAMAAGCEPAEFPGMPPEWIERGETDALEFMEVIVRATEPSPERRYRSATEMLADFALLESGQSVRRVRLLERRWWWAKRVALAAVAMVALSGALLWLWQKEAARDARTRAAEALAAQARIDEREQRFLALRERAAATLRSPMAGAGIEALRTIDEAATLQPGDPALRDLLVTALTRADFSPIKEWTHDEPFMAPALSPDTTLVALLEKDGGIRIENTADGALVRRLPPWPGTRPWAQWRFTADGRYLGVRYGRADAPEASRFRWWRVSDGAVAWEGEPGVVSLGGVPARGNLITAFDPRTRAIIRYDLESGQQADARILPEDAGGDFVLSPDGARAVFFGTGGDMVNQAAFVDVARARISRRAEVNFMSRAVAWLPDSRHVVLGGASAPFEAAVLSVDDTEPARHLPLHSSFIVDVAVSPDSQLLLTSSWDQTTRLTHLITGQPEALAAGHGASGQTGFSADGSRCWRTVTREGDTPKLVLCELHRPFLSALSSGRPESRLNRPFFSPDGRWLIVTGDDVLIFDLQRSREAAWILKEAGGAQGCAFVSDDSGAAFLFGCPSGLFRVRPPLSEGEAWKVEPRLAAGDFDEVVASADGRMAIAYGYDVPSLAIRDGTISAWPADRAVISAGVSADGQVAAYSVRGSRRIRLQDRTGAPIGVVSAQPNSWVSVAADGSRLFLNEADAITCRSLRERRELWRLPKEFPLIRGAPVFLDGGRLLVAKPDLRFAVIDATTGAVRCRFEPSFPFHGEHAATSPDGTLLAISSPDSLLLFDLHRLRSELRQRGLDW